MFIYSIIFVSSLVLIVGMLTARLLYEKLHDEHLFHKLVTSQARRADWHLKERFAKASQKIKIYFGYFNKKTFSLLIHLVIEKVDHYFHKVTDFVKNKFPHHK